MLTPNSKEDLFQLAILKEIENYKPVAEAEAKIENKNVENQITPGNLHHNIDYFIRNVNPFSNGFTF